VIALLAWWYALVTGRMPDGMRDLGAACLRYSAQTYAYLMLLTDRYPYSTPLLRAPAPVEVEAVRPGTAPLLGDAF
jgi:hypothetical protein